MSEFREKYINFFTDYGFQIVELNYLKTEHFGTTDLDRKAVFDLYCENEKGEKFIVELQKSKQNFFKDRSVY